MEVACVFELVKVLSELPGPTGHEDAVQDWVEQRWTTFAQEVRRTRVNNILARVGGTGPRLVLVAHAGTAPRLLLDATHARDAPIGPSVT